MKNHAKIGNKQGRPAYRTPAAYRTRKAINTAKIRNIGKNKRKSK